MRGISPRGSAGGASADFGIEPIGLQDGEAGGVEIGQPARQGLPICYLRSTTSRSTVGSGISSLGRSRCGGSVGQASANPEPMASSTLSSAKRSGTCIDPASRCGRPRSRRLAGEVESFRIEPEIDRLAIADDRDAVDGRSGLTSAGPHRSAGCCAASNEGRVSHSNAAIFSASKQ